MHIKTWFLDLIIIETKTAKGRAMTTNKRVAGKNAYGAWSNAGLVDHIEDLTSLPRPALLGQYLTRSHFEDDMIALLRVTAVRLRAIDSRIRELDTFITQLLQERKRWNQNVKRSEKSGKALKEERKSAD
jgi:hypothetical protein